MLSRLLRQFLFKLIHLVVNILVAVQHVYHRFWKKRQILPTNAVTKSEIKLILEYVPRVTKKLKHLVVLVDTTNHTFNDLALLVIWSLIAGISYMSFYDITGHLKENDEKLFLEIEKKKKGVPGCIKWFKKPDLNGYTNGLQANTIFINIFSYNDGPPKIAQCIQYIAQNKIICNRESNEFTTEELDRALKLIYPSIPDPDLVLYTGPQLCTYGLLPWQIRLTEFIPMSLDHSINIDNYVGALYRYNKCDQRFGK